MRYIHWVPVSCRKPDAKLDRYRKKYGPDSYIEVIAFIEGAEIPTMLGYDGSGFFAVDSNEYDNCDREYYCVTHWMSMPPAPHECLVQIDLGDQIEANFDLLEAFLA